MGSRTVPGFGRFPGGVRGSYYRAAVRPYNGPGSAAYVAGAHNGAYDGEWVYDRLDERHRLYHRLHHRHRLYNGLHDGLCFYYRGHVRSGYNFFRGSNGCHATG